MACKVCVEWQKEAMRHKEACRMLSIENDKLREENEYLKDKLKEAQDESLRP